MAGVMCMCVNICMCVCMCKCVCAHLCIYVYTCLCLHETRDKPHMLLPRFCPPYFLTLVIFNWPGNFHGKLG